MGTECFVILHILGHNFTMTCGTNTATIFNCVDKRVSKTHTHNIWLHMQMYCLTSVCFMISHMLANCSLPCEPNILSIFNYVVKWISNTQQYGSHTIMNKGYVYLSTTCLLTEENCTIRPARKQVNLISHSRVLAETQEY